MTPTQTQIRLRSPRGEIEYADGEDHFRNGLLRLLNLDDDEFARWLALAEEASAPSLLERLGLGWAALRPLAPPPGVPAGGAVGPGPGGIEGRLLHPAIAESPGWGVALSDAAGHGWLVRHDGAAFVCERQPPTYEEAYFEGDKLSAGGYGDYTEQAGWRLEKSRRQVREMLALTGLAGGRVLDIGCGYGYFRVALEEAGYEHEGLEVSAFARAVAHESYGFATCGGVLEDHSAGWRGRFDGIVLFDLVEHLEDPDRFMEQVRACLRPGGVVGIKTPNISCPEAGVFGPWYHSLKREHLQFFSGESLTACAARAGLEPAALGSISHLLAGFVGREQCDAWERAGLGADLASWYRRHA
ncbi:MAG TPA: class I SAM-dependent methyltransferase [Baekduia sp.]|uniref:class I SAM-dependent methyltransferase n=1 Tax=Baekduia sp. TaxID=2600305 RepID=UPI002C60D4D6|nr:class I SAM-dependent methyltransferase [Baekduia sp.]HMJ34323.1 class I SAM-dependent methyltransferase [Baekduia sp.]